MLSDCFFVIRKKDNKEGYEFLPETLDPVLSAVEETKKGRTLSPCSRRLRSMAKSACGHIAAAQDCALTPQQGRVDTQSGELCCKQLRVSVTGQAVCCSLHQPKLERRGWWKEKRFYSKMLALRNDSGLPVTKAAFPSQYHQRFYRHTGRGKGRRSWPGNLRKRPFLEAGWPQGQE